MNRAEHYHNMTNAELNTEYMNKKQELFNLRFQHSVGQLKNPLMLNTVKKDIARVLTILKEREMNLPRNKGKAKAEKPKVVAQKKEVVAKKEVKAAPKPAAKKPVKKEGGAK